MVETWAMINTVNQLQVLVVAIANSGASENCISIMYSLPQSFFW